MHPGTHTFLSACIRSQNLRCHKGCRTRETEGTPPPNHKHRTLLSRWRATYRGVADPSSTRFSRDEGRISVRHTGQVFV